MAKDSKSKSDDIVRKDINGEVAVKSAAQTADGLDFIISGVVKYVKSFDKGIKINGMGMSTVCDNIKH